MLGISGSKALQNILNLPLRIDLEATMKTQTGPVPGIHIAIGSLLGIFANHFLPIWGSM